MSESATPESGALSFDEAVASLAAPEPEAQDENNAPEAAEDAPPGAEDPEAESSPPEDAGEAEEPGDGDTEDAEVTAEAEPLSAPQYWTKEEKDFFTSLDRKAQEILVSQETKREAAVQKAKQQASETEKAAKERMVQAETLASALKQVAPADVAKFAVKWAGVEQGPAYWAAVRQHYGVEQAANLKDEYEHEARLLQQAAVAQRETERLAREDRIKEAEEKLPEHAPALADPRDGKARWQRTKDFLVSLGANADEVEQMGAIERGLAYDAMLHRQAMKAATGEPRPKQPARQSPRPAARPAAALPGTSQQRAERAVVERFNETRSFDDAVALLASKG